MFDGTGGYYHISSVEFILRVLEDRPPVHQEARMLLTGLDLFKFTLRRDERPEMWFQVSTVSLKKQLASPTSA